MSLAAFITDQIRRSNIEDYGQQFYGDSDPQRAALARVAPDAFVEMEKNSLDPAKQVDLQAKQAKLSALSEFGGTSKKSIPEGVPVDADTALANMANTNDQPNYRQFAALGLLSPEKALELEQHEKDKALERLDKQNKPIEPQSALAKLYADHSRGLIDDPTFHAAVKKETERPPRAYNQFQQTSAGFAERMVNTQNLVSKAEQTGMNPVNNTASALGTTPLVGDYLKNLAQSPEQQTYWNAAQEWIRSKLRKESGAAIGKDEMEKEFRTYFPMPGDAEKVIKQKAQLRKVATDTMIKQSSGAYEDMFGTPTDGGGAVAAKAPTALEGKTAINRQTGQRIVYRNGKWSPL